jgi:hypothetical protein
MLLLNCGRLVTVFTQHSPFDCMHTRVRERTNSRGVGPIQLPLPSLCVRCTSPLLQHKQRPVDSKAEADGSYDTSDNWW